MANIYPYAQIVHLFLAIIFLGYIFFDVVILKKALKDQTPEQKQKISSLIGSVAFKIMPLSLLFIILSGGMMMSLHVNSNVGYFSTAFQQIFMLKVGIALLLVLGVIINITRKLTKKKSLFPNFHIFALICGFFIVLFAKIMYLV